MELNFWDKRFSKEQYAYGTEPNDFLKENTGYFPAGGKILCIAEGEGRNAVHLARAGLNVHAVDISKIGRQKAEKLAAKHGVSIDYHISDINNFDFGENQWDGIVYIFAHTDSQTRAKVLENTLTGLNKGGIFCLEAYHPKQAIENYGTGGPPQIDYLVTASELETAFDGCEIITSQAKERDVIEGPHHTGKAYITQFLCRKA